MCIFACMGAPLSGVAHCCLYSLEGAKVCLAHKANSQRLIRSRQSIGAGGGGGGANGRDDHNTQPTNPPHPWPAEQTT